MRMFGAFAFVVCLGLLGGCGDVNTMPTDGPQGGDTITRDGPIADTSNADTLLCDPDSTSCGADMNLYQCSHDGTMLTKVMDCQFGCAGTACKQCNSAVPMFCNGDNLAVCNANGMIASMTPCMHGCQMNRCNMCTPGARFCDMAGNSVMCNTDGTPGAMTACGAAGCNAAQGVCNSCVGNTTSCQGDSLVVCSNGMPSSTTPCALGCATTPSPRCRNLVPSYGVGTPSGTLPDLTINAASTIDISACTGTPNTVNVTIGMTMMSIVGAPQVAVVGQAGGPPICVVKFGNISVQSGQTLTITNSSSADQVLSLQAAGTFDIQGTIAFRTNFNGPAPGGSTTAPMVTSGNHHAPGGGGGGNALAGGLGGACVGTGCAAASVPGGPGGAAVTTTTTALTSGSRGGGVTDSGTGAALGFGGQGGGGLQLISLVSLTIGATGTIDLNGGGGFGLSRTIRFTVADLPAGGAGSGGTLVIEAPAVSLSAGAIVAGNGGGGAGGCYSCSLLFCFHANGQPG